MFFLDVPLSDFHFQGQFGTPSAITKDTLQPCFLLLQPIMMPQWGYKHTAAKCLLFTERLNSKFRKH